MPHPFDDVIRVLLDGRFDDAEELFKTVQANEPDELEKGTNEAFYYLLRYLQGDRASALEQLEDLSRRPGFRSYALNYLARVHRCAGALDKAISHHEQALALNEPEDDRAMYAADLADVLTEAGRAAEAERLVRSELSRPLSDENRRQLYLALFDALKSLGETAECAALQREISDLPRPASPPHQESDLPIRRLPRTR